MAASKREGWVRRVAEFERSGLSRRAWCTARGVNLSTLDYWRGRVGSRAVAVRKRAVRAVGAPRGPSFVPLRVAVSATGKEAAIPAAGAEAIVLAVDGLRLMLPQGIGAAWLALLLRELR